MFKFLIFLNIVIISTNCHTLRQTKYDSNCIISSLDDVSEVTQNCNNVVVQDVEVPGGESLELNLKDGTTLTFDGVTTFGKEAWNGPLLIVKGNNLVVEASSTESLLDGQGPLYWDGKGEHSTTKPIFFHIEASNSIFRNINLLNCPLHCTDIANTTNTVFTNWNINNTAGQIGIAKKGKEGHNTDGFFMYLSHNVTVKDSVIVNQDDCAVIRSGSNILVSHLNCNGSHGFSLSAGDSKTSVEANTITNVTFEHSIIVNADNAIHVKTHTDGGPGSIKDITYRNISVADIKKYGVIIQQDYADGTSTKHAVGNIPISNLTLEHITGTMADKSKKEVYIYCAENACIDWYWSDVSITGSKHKNNCTYVPDGFEC